ncbi:MAG: hypothetical protein ACI9T7_001686, partial [Oleiphilaceae bacterium]
MQALANSHNLTPSNIPEVMPVVVKCIWQDNKDGSQSTPVERNRSYTDVFVQ